MELLQKIEKKCKFCGNKFKVYPSLSRIKYCSRDCYKLGKIGEKMPQSIKDKIKKTMKRRNIKGPVRRGKDCNFWRGGVDKINKPIRRLIRDCKKYKDWRKKIMERDNYTCQMC